MSPEKDSSGAHLSGNCLKYRAPLLCYSVFLKEQQYLPPQHVQFLPSPNVTDFFFQQSLWCIQSTKKGENEKGGILYLIQCITHSQLSFPSSTVLDDSSVRQTSSLGLCGFCADSASPSALCLPILLMRSKLHMLQLLCPVLPLTRSASSASW